MNKTLIVVGGPTGTGKTKIALELSEKFNGELINADSRQIYKYLDIGTNKENLEEKMKNEKRKMKNSEQEISNQEDTNFVLRTSHFSVPIHLMSFLEPDKRFNLFDYKKLAEEKILEILERNKTPILVGGTGLYIDSILRGYKLIKQNLNPKLEILKRDFLETKTIKELEEIIINRDINVSLNPSDSKNPRRLIRVIEKFQESEIPVATNTNINNIAIGNQELEVKFYYPKYDLEELKIKLENRVDQMFEDGIIEETKKVLEMGFDKNCPGLNVMGYKECIDFLDNKITLEECKKQIKLAHISYAKRQRTWFEGKGRNYNLIVMN